MRIKRKILNKYYNNFSCFSKFKKTNKFFVEKFGNSRYKFICWMNGIEFEFVVMFICWQIAFNFDFNERKTILNCWNPIKSNKRRKILLLCINNIIFIYYVHGWADGRTSGWNFGFLYSVFFVSYSIIHLSLKGGNRWLPSKDLGGASSLFWILYETDFRLNSTSITVKHSYEKNYAALSSRFTNALLSLKEGNSWITRFQKEDGLLNTISIQ